MNRRLMPYPSLQCVLEYMDANQRFLLSIHVPSLRKIEKQVSLRIDNLTLSRFHPTINRIDYQLGIHRQYPKGSIPLPYFQRLNENGGERHDLDQFGRPDPGPEGILTAGDFFTESPEVGYRTNTESEWRKITRQNWLRLKKLEVLGVLEKGQMEEKEMLQARVNSNFLAHANLPLPYTMYLQLTVKDSLKNIQKVERIEYSKKKPEAVKYLVDKFVGGRKSSVFVKQLKLDRKGDIIRLPLNLRFWVNELYITDHVSHIMNCLYPFLDPRSILIQKVSITGSTQFKLLKNQQHHVVKYAKTLSLNNLAPENSWIQIVRDLRNPNVHVDNCKFSSSDFVEIAQRIIRDQLMIGTRRSFGVYRRHTAKEALWCLGLRIDVKNETRRHCNPPLTTIVRIPINDESDLVISVENHCEADIRYGISLGNMEALLIMDVMDRPMQIAVPEVKESENLCTIC